MSPWEWGSEQESTLNALKQKAVTTPSLGFLKELKPFVIRVVANEVALPATLLQNNKEVELVPVAYDFKKLQGAELNFDLCECECLATV